jgi:hypothetical protein
VSLPTDREKAVLVSGSSFARRPDAPPWPGADQMPPPSRAALSRRAWSPRLVSTWLASAALASARPLPASP